MKTNELRKTVLILFGTLLAAFTLCTWWMSRQVANLRETTAALSDAKEKLATVKTQLQAAERQFVSIVACTKDLNRQIARQPAKATVLLLHRAKRGFNDIEHHVANGEFSGLALTDGYMALREMFDNPAFEEMLEGYHAVAP
jgi:hypothetical protein